MMIAAPNGEPSGLITIRLTCHQTERVFTANRGQGMVRETLLLCADYHR